MRIRLLPLALFAGALLLTVRAGNLWNDLSITAGSSTAAETTPPIALTPPPAGDGATPAAPPAAQAAPTQTAAAMPGVAGGSEPPAPASPAGATTPATAPASAGPAPSPDAATQPAAPDAAAPAGSQPPAIDPLGLSDEELGVLQSLAKRREELDARERALAQREALLTAAEQRMDQKLEELKGLQHSIEALMKQHDAQEEERLKSLVKIYENMKPRDAARIFEQLDMDVLLDVVERMREARVAPILALVNPSRAQEITIQLAERRKLPVAAQ